jgi:hypothetical protein
MAACRKTTGTQIMVAMRLQPGRNFYAGKREHRSHGGFSSHIPGAGLHKEVEEMSFWTHW